MSRQRIRHFAVALILSVVMTAASASSVPAGFGSSRAKTGISVEAALSRSAPIADNTRPNAIPAIARPRHEIFGFALASSLSDPTVGYPTWNFDLLSTVAFFGVHVDTAGHFVGDSGWNVWNSAALRSLVSIAHQHGTKVVLTIVLQDFRANTPSMCAGLAHADATVAQTVSEVRAKGADGVNIDYEGLDGGCGTGDPFWAQHAMTSMAQKMRTALGSSSYLSIDTYSGSASDPYGFFDIAGLANYVDSMFVMAYDMEYSNYSGAPLYCSSFCLGPTSPLTRYRYNDASVVSEYVGAVPAGKVILGVPYYGRKACVANASSPNQYPTSSVVADSYLDASGEAAYFEVKAGTYAVHRESNSAGLERWDTWYNTTLNCTRQLYWDDAVSLGKKYDLVIAAGLRGAGIWNLNYGGGAPELWAALQSHFAGCTAAAVISAPASPQPQGTQVRLTATSNTCPKPLYEFWMLPAGSTTWQLVQGYSTTATFNWNSTGALVGTESFGVWVRDASSSASYDTFASIPYTMTPACTSVVTSAAPPSAVQSRGSSVTITGSASGCPKPLYQFWMLPAGSSTWQLVQPYSTSAAFSWNSTGALAGTLRFGIWARDASSPSSYDAYASMSYTVTPACTSVIASAAPLLSVHGSGVTVTITGSASGCPKPLYQFWMLPAGSTAWQLVQAYSTSATFRWNSTGALAGTERFGVWVRDANSPASYDTYASLPYTVTPACTSVITTAAPASPSVHGAGVVVTITGVASGCANPLYEFWMLPAGSTTWQLVQGYSTNATFRWNTSGALAGTERFGVWVRDAGSSGTNTGALGAYDTYVATTYALI